MSDSDTTVESQEAQGTEDKSPIEFLGFLAKDKVTGVKGHIVGFTQSMYSSDQFTIQPVAEEDNKLVDAIIGDVVQTSYLSNTNGDFAPELHVTEPSYEGDVSLGDKVRDELTGFKGIVTNITYHVNGCVICGVVPKQPSDRKAALPGTNYISILRLQVVEPEKVQYSPKESGGPVERASKRGLM